MWCCTEISTLWKSNLQSFQRKFEELCCRLSGEVEDTAVPQRSSSRSFYVELQEVPELDAWDSGSPRALWDFVQATWAPASLEPWEYSHLDWPSMALPVFAFRVRQTWEILAMQLLATELWVGFLGFEPQCPLLSSGDSCVCFWKLGPLFFSRLCFHQLSNVRVELDGVYRLIDFSIPRGCF